MSRALGTRRRRRFAAAGALILTAAVLATVLSGPFSGNGDGSSRAATSATATTEIRRQDLVEVETEQGTLGFADTRDVINRLSGTVTRLPDEGAVIAPDGVLYRVDGQPAILLDGRVPAYRDLGPEVSDGRDVAQLERNLRALGYDRAASIDLDDSWDTGTTAAVERWQQAHGLEQTGIIALGTLVFQPGRRRVATLAATLGGDTRGGGGRSQGGPPGGGEEGASIRDRGAQTAFASYQTPPSAPEMRDDEESPVVPEKAPRAKEAPRRAPSDQPRPEQPPLPPQPPPGPPPPGDAGAAVGGAPPGGAEPPEAPPPSNIVMTTTSTRPVVIVDLDTSNIALATPRTAVEVELPSGADVRGRITSVDSVATAPEGGQGAEQAPTTDATVEVTIRLRTSTRTLDQAPVVVNLERSRRRNVLAVPVTALLSRARGEFAVEVRDGPRRRLVPVEPGLFAGGFVEIAGQELRAGMIVTDARV